MDLKGSSCPICFESLKDKTVGSPDVCHHKFCLSCLEKWTKHGNFCPVDRQKFKKIICGDEVIPVRHKRKKRDSELYDISVFCEICKSTKENNDTVILCDSCDLAFHVVCLKPPLRYIPRGNWHCPDCLEISKRLEIQKKKKGKYSNNLSVYSKQSSSLPPSHFAALTPSSNLIRKENSDTNDEGQDANGNFINDEYNYSKVSYFSAKDDNQNNFPHTKTVSMPFNCTDTSSGEFEDFFNISNNVVTLTNRKLLLTEEKSPSKRIGEESRINSSAELRRLRPVKIEECNNLKKLETKKRKMRLAASIARKKMVEVMKKEQMNFSVENFSYSLRQCDAAAIEKPKSTSEVCSEAIKRNSAQIEKLNENAASKSSNAFENSATFINTKSPDLVRESIKRNFYDAKEASLKTCSTSTKVYNSMSGKLNVQNHTVLESLNISREVDTISTNCKSLGIDDMTLSKKTAEDTLRVNSKVNCITAGKKFPETRTKRLAAAIARKKLAHNFLSDHELSSDLSSDSINHHNAVEKDSFRNPFLNSSHYYLFTDIEKVLFSQNSRNELFSSESKSEKAHLNSNSECSKSTKRINIVVKDSDRSSASKSSNICENLGKSITARVSNCVTESSDSIKSQSEFKKTGCESFPACTKINDSMTEELNSAEIPMILESFSRSEKHGKSPELNSEPLHAFKNCETEIPPKKPPELNLEPMHIFKNSKSEISCESSLPSLIPIKNLENGMYTIKEAEAEHDHSVVEELYNAKKNSSSETFSVFEKITNISNSTEKYSDMNRYNNKETFNHMKDLKSAKNPENDEISQGKSNYPDDKIEADENILNNFHMRQVHYAIKAKINLPSELQKIEEEAWLSHRSKSSWKYKHKSFHKKTKIYFSHDQVVSGKKEIQVLSNDNPHDGNKSADSKQDLNFNNKFNPFCQSVCGSPPKKLFKVTEYAIQQVRSKNVLRNIMDPYSLKHLDIREDGSLFLNWNKSNYVSSF